MAFSFSFPFKGEERKTTLISAFLLFAVTAAFVILKSARDALFLSNYPARILPYFMAITPIATALVSFTYLRLYKALSLREAVDLSLKAFAVGTLILWAGIKLEWRFATFSLYIWVGVYAALAPVQAWSVISQSLLTRQAKRAFGLIGAGGIAGASAGGFFAKWVSEGAGVPALLPAGMIAILLGLFACQALTALAYVPPSKDMPMHSGKVRPKFIVLVLIVVGTVSIVSTFADYQFKITAQKTMETAEELAPFFGSFYAYIGIGTLLFQVFVTPALMNRIGTAGALAFLPVALAAGNAWILATASLAAAIFLKGSEQLFRFSIYRSSLEVVYMAIPEDSKIRLKSLLDTVAVRTAEAGAGLLLILLFSIEGFSLNVLAWISLVFLAVCVAGSILLQREYPKALSGAIRKEEINLSGVRAEFFTTDFYHVLPELLQNSARQTVLDLLQLLGNTGSRKLNTYLLPLLDHKEAEVRLRALQLLFTQEDDFSSRVEKMVSDPDRRIRVEAIHYLCFRSSIDPLEKLAHLMTDPEPTIQAAACACSLNLEVGPDQQFAFQKLESLLSQSASTSQMEVRLEVAHVLEYVKPSGSSDELYRKLLSDPSPEVRRVALHSVNKTRPPAVLLDLLRMVGDTLVRADLRTAIASYGEEALQHVKPMLADESVPQDEKKLLLRIATDLQSSKAAELLMSMALGSNMGLRFVAIKGLNRMRRRQALPLPKTSLTELLEQELTSLELEQERSRFALADRDGLLESVLNQRKAWARERIFRVLGLLYEPKSIYNAYRALLSNDPRRADSGLEFLDATLAPEFRTRVLNLLELKKRAERNIDVTARKSVLLGYLGARDELPAAAIIADTQEGELKNWRYEIDQVMRAFPNLPLVEETLQWRYSVMDMTTKAREKLTTIQKLEHLSKVDIFSQMGPQELLILANQCNQIDLDGNRVIFREGERASEIFALVQGNVELWRANGHTTSVAPNQSFGTLSVLSDQPHIFTAKTLEPSMCLTIDRDSLWDILEDYPTMTQGIFKILAVRMKMLTDGDNRNSPL